MTNQRELKYIDLKDLKVSPLNVRKNGELEIDDLAASIASNGIFQPLLVRPNCKGFEVVAGQRRLLAKQLLAAEQDNREPLPCMVLESQDDALAIEASLAENFARLPMDEFDQYEAFAALHAQNVNVEEIAAKFGVTDRMVKQRLALANLHADIRTAYRNEEIEASTLRALTMATKRQQKEWLKLYNDEEAETPQGWWLKSWLFGGEEIPVSLALFDLKDYKGAIVSDLFSEDQYFADHGKFWKCQNKALAERSQAYQDDGWSEVVILDTGKRFCKYYDHQQVPKDEGGRVYVTVSTGGEVTFHEGFLTSREAKKLERAKASANGEAPEKIARPELTKAAQLYLDLHRHNAVRGELLKSPSVSLRLMVAHAICGSSLWSVKAECQDTQRNEAIQNSVNDCKAQKAFKIECEAIKKLLNLKPKDRFMLGADWQRPDLCTIFARLLDMSDKDVMRVLTFTIAQTLASGSASVEALGPLLNVDMGQWWEPEQTFFDLLRDKQMINAMLAEVAGKNVARDSLTATAKVQKATIQKQLNGEGGRTKPEGWLPRFMHFPMQAYTKRGGLNAMDNGKAIAKLFKGKK